MIFRRVASVLAAVALVCLGTANAAQANQPPPGDGSGYAPITLSASGTGGHGSIQFTWHGLQDITSLTYKIYDTNCDDTIVEDLAVYDEIYFVTENGVGYTGKHWVTAGCGHSSTQTQTSFHIGTGPVIYVYLIVCVAESAVDPAPDVARPRNVKPAFANDAGDCYTSGHSNNPYE